MLFENFSHSSSTLSSKTIGHILKIIRLIIIKMKIKIKNRSRRYDINRSRSRHGHKYS